MPAFESSRPRSKFPLVVVFLLILVVGIGAAAFVLRPRFETEPPQVKVSPAGDVIGVATPIEIHVTDRGTGLRSVRATLTAGGTEHALLAEELSQPAAERKIAVDPAKLKGLREGPAVLKVTARDWSYWNAFKGNDVSVEKQLTIDITPPTLELVADDRYINFGGVGAIVYKASADAATSGVKIGDAFFPGFKGVVKGNPEHYFVLFAHPYNVDAASKAALVATDRAGNTRQVAIAYELKNVRYKKSTIPLSDAFIQNKVAPLLSDAAARQGAPKDVFVAVNRKLRKENEDKITAITKKATPQMLWKGAFSQLSNSKVEANFADHRTYVYNAEAIDTAYHVGFDLSVTKQYPVEASNSGTVAFSGDLGIYGNTVILDHGLGLFTLYSHLSAIDVKVGDAVTARQVLGKTGETGLAAGDHLHYGVYLSGVPVLPVEWWDAKWINDNVQPKLEGQSGVQIAEAQQPKGGARKAAAPQKRRR